MRLPAIMGARRERGCHYMPVRKHRSAKLFVILAASVATIITLSVASASQPTPATSGKAYRQLLPVMISSPVTKTSTLAMINQLRANAGVPAVQYSPILEKNCFEHARYMAENAELTHRQNPNHPFASSSGQTCARQANVWLGSALPPVPWKATDPIKSWMASVPHRIWLIYPTTGVMGYSFYTDAATKRAAAALDILSGADFAADERYRGWPVRYPGSGETNIPATQFPITLNWRYFGPEPELKSVQLRTANGTNIPHDATTQMSIGHKGIQITPKIALPKQSTIIVSVSGKYDGQPFSYSWSFSTGSAQQAAPTRETASID